MKKKKQTHRSPDQNDIHVGGRIRAQRLLQKMSQTDLAEKCGVTFQQIQKYEKGMNRVSASRLIRIAEVLKCSESYLLKGTEAELHTPLNLITDAASARLLKAFARMEGHEERMALVHLAEHMARLVEQLRRRLPRARAA